MKALKESIPIDYSNVEGVLRWLVSAVVGLEQVQNDINVRTLLWRQQIAWFSGGMAFFALMAGLVLVLAKFAGLL